jgi:predicted P-loop ATPase/GTPase
VPWNEADDLYLRHSIDLIRQWATKATDLLEADHHMMIIVEQAEVVIKSVQRGATPWHDKAPMDYIMAVAPELLASTPTEKRE